MIDLVLATCDRLSLLKRTLRSIWENTPEGSYQIHVIDDASTEGNQAYLEGLLAKGKIASLTKHTRRLGVGANLREIERLTTSRLVVYCDDDQLAPKVEPDWLTRLVEEMKTRPKQGVLSLNNPHGNMGDKRKKLGTDGKVTFCLRSGGSFMCIRRSLLPLIVPPDDGQSPVSDMCIRARRLGWENGYLTETYTQHIGAQSVRWKKDYTAAMEELKPVDAKTLEPRDEYRG